MGTSRATFVTLLVVSLIGCPGEAPQRPPDQAVITLHDGAPPRDGVQHDQHVAGDLPTSPDLPGPSPDLPPTHDKGSPGALVPPRGASSGGQGGGPAPSGTTINLGSVSYILIVPSGYSAATPTRLMIVYSGTEGATVMASNLRSVAPMSGLSDVIFAVLDGPATFGNGASGVPVLDDVRARYNIDNDRTFLLSESAGTQAGLALGLQLRQSYFAAYWANDVNASASPSKTAAQLGFAPWGNAGPGGQLATAQAIVNGMKTAGYRLPADAPYSGAGSTQHGNTQQFLAAIAFFDGKTR